jgi:hypothetical protein
VGLKVDDFEKFMPDWLDTVQQKLVTQITSKMVQIKADKITKNESNWLACKTEVLNELNKCKEVNKEKTGHEGHKGQKVDHHTKAAKKIGKTGV